MIRGLVISHPIILDLSTGMFRLTTEGLDPQALRNWVLFWDRLDYPTGGMFTVSNTTDGEFLEKAGILRRTPWSGLRGIEGVELVARPHLETYLQLDEAEPGTWSLAMGDRAFDARGLPQDVGRGLYVKLVDAIPVPSVEVPLEDVLRFKEKRADELLGLRVEVEGLYQELCDSPDRPLGETLAVQRVRTAAVNHLKATIDASFPTRLTSWAANFNFVGAAAGFLGAQAAGLGIDASMAHGLQQGAAIEVGVTGGFGRGGTVSPYAYVASYHRDLFPRT